MNNNLSRKSLLVLICTVLLSSSFQYAYACHGTGLANAISTYNSNTDETVVEVEFCLGIADLFGLPSDFEINFEGVPFAPTLNPSSTTLTTSFDFNLGAEFVTFFCDCDDNFIGIPPIIESNTETWTGSTSAGTVSYSVSSSNSNLNNECQMDCLNEPPTAVTGGNLNYTTDISACYVISVTFPGNLDGILTGVSLTGAENGQCDSDEDMVIDFAGGGPLAVDLSSFDGKSIKDAVEINWTTTSEYDVYKYIVERSNNGVERFETVGTVGVFQNSLSEKEYSLVDRAPIATGYYRLKTVDIDGSVSYSHVVAIEKEIAGMRIVNIYPNPIESATEIIYETKALTDIQFRVFDMNGTTIANWTLDPVDGYNRIPFDFSSLHEGIYFILLENGEEKIVKRVTKIHQ